MSSLFTLGIRLTNSSFNSRSSWNCKSMVECYRRLSHHCRVCWILPNQIIAFNLPTLLYAYFSVTSGQHFSIYLGFLFVNKQMLCAENQTTQNIFRADAPWSKMPKYKNAALCWVEGQHWFKLLKRIFWKAFKRHSSKKSDNIKVFKYASQSTNGRQTYRQN